LIAKCFYLLKGLYLFLSKKDTILIVRTIKITQMAGNNMMKRKTYGNRHASEELVGGVKAHYKSKTLPPAYRTYLIPQSTSNLSYNRSTKMKSTKSMKSALTLLTAFVLLSSSFMFSSCKGCKGKPEDKAGGSDVENRGDAPAQSNPAPGPAPAPVPAPAPPDTTPSHAKRIGKVLISDTDLSPAERAKRDKIEALIMNKVVPDLHELLNVCDDICRSIKISVGDISFKASEGPNRTMKEVIEIVKAKNPLKAFAMKLAYIQRIRINTFCYYYNPIRKKNLDELNELKTVLDNIIVGYKEPPSAEVDNWFKDVDSRSDNKSKLDACTDKLILHQTDWENILKD
jgi:hypothetical protein